VIVRAYACMHAAYMSFVLSSFCVLLLGFGVFLFLPLSLFCSVVLSFLCVCRFVCVCVFVCVYVCS